MDTNHFRIESFSVANFRSFCEEQVINFGSTVKAFYGANASGKSNIYSAFLIFKLFILQSTDPNSHGVPYAPFLLLKGMDKKPTTFKALISNGSNKYEYSFAIQGDKVVEEEMHDLTSKRPREVFVRSKGANDTSTRNGFDKKFFVGNDSVRPDSLLITLARRTNNVYASAVFDAITNLGLASLEGVQSLKTQAIESLQKDDRTYKELTRIIKKTDLNIYGFSFNVKTPNLSFFDGVKREIIVNDSSVNTVHAIRNTKGDRVDAAVFDMEAQESLGTNKFFILMVFIIDAVNNGKMIYIDEFGNSLHTDLCKFIIKYFKQNGAKSGARLILNTHDIGLIKNGSIGILEKEDIDIVEKDRFEQTNIIPLTKRMRRADDNIGKKYTLGLYGGVPILDEAYIDE